MKAVKRKSPKKPVKSSKPLLPAKLGDEALPEKSSAKAEALQAYIQSIKRYPLLSPEKEHEVAAKYFATKDKASAQILILANLRLVVKIAYEYLRSGFHVLDLIQEGNVGLMRAIQDYDPHRGVKFSSYASHWVKAYIRSFILSNWSLVKMGTTKAQRTLFYRLQRERAKLEAMGLPAGPKLLAEKLNVNEKDVIDMSQRLSGKDISLNAPLRSEEGEGDSLVQLLKDDASAADEKLAESEVMQEFQERLDAFERTLAGKELIIFRERLRSESPKTLQDIGDIYQITRERVRQIEVRVMEKLRSYMKANARFKENVIDVKPSRGK